jgi:hypothetical protein
MSNNDAVYASNKIIPISISTAEPTPVLTTVPSESKSTKMVLECIGWAGSLLVLCPYVFTFEKTIDFVLNTLGATGLLIVCVKSRQYQSIVINAAWVVGGIYKYYANS